MIIKGETSLFNRNLFHIYVNLSRSLAYCHNDFIQERLPLPRHLPPSIHGQCIGGMARQA